MKAQIKKLNAQIDALEAEFRKNDARLQELKPNRTTTEFRTLQERQRAINDEIHDLLEQLWKAQESQSTK